MKITHTGLFVPRYWLQIHKFSTWLLPAEMRKLRIRSTKENLFIREVIIIIRVNCNDNVNTSTQDEESSCQGWRSREN